MACGFGLLDFFQGQKELLLRQGLGPAAEAVALQFLDDLPQPLALGALGQEHRLEQVGIIGQSGRGGHEAK
jgi:hypothetical protein